MNLIHLWLIALLAGSSEPPPSLTPLEQSQVYKNAELYTASFRRGEVSIHSNNSYQKPLSTYLICLLAETPDFSPEQDLQNPAQGMVDFVAQQDSKPGGQYRFKAHLIFSHIDSSTVQTQSISSNAEVKALLASHTRLSRKARTLLYYGPAYYSNIINIPADRIKTLAAKTTRKEQ